MRLFLLATILILTQGCNKSEIVYQSKFDKSFAAWQKFKKNSGNSYEYQVRTMSWTGHGSTTTITVKQGIVVKRIYKGIFPYPEEADSLPPEALGFVEEGDQVNAHNLGAPGITLDEVYHRAKTIWLIRRSDASSYFEAENNGMISTCGFVTDGCADDCFNGIHIDYIIPLTDDTALERYGHTSSNFEQS